MRVVGFGFSAIATRAWTADADTSIVGVYSTKNCVISSDPNFPATDFTTSTLDRTVESIFVGVSTSNQFVAPLKIPLYKSQVIFVAISGAGWVVLYLEDIV